MKQKYKSVNELHRQLQLAKIKMEDYEIMGDILEEKYEIDLLKNPQPSSLPTPRTTHRSVLFGYSRQAYYKQINTQASFVSIRFPIGSV